MSTITVIRELLAYTLSADRRLLRAVAEVDPEDLHREAGSSFGSVVGTLAHILGAEQVWLSRFVGDPLDHVPGVETYPDLAALEGGFEDFWPQAEYFLASLTEAMLEGDLHYTNTRGEAHTLKLWQALMHLSHHSAYHRGQVVTLLRQMGYAPPATDLMLFFLERNSQPSSLR
jgi:uncharacterized damage-inducible protein DinB